MGGFQFYYIGFDNIIKKFFIASGDPVSLSTQGMNEQAAHMVHALTLLWVLTIAAFVAERVFLAVEINKDRRTINARHASLWTAAVGVLGWIPAACYFIACQTVYAKKVSCAANGATVTMSLPRTQMSHNRLLIALGIIAAGLAFFLYNYAASCTFGLHDMASIPLWIQKFPL